MSQDTVIAARELDLDGLDNRNWVNDHTVYTTAMVWWPPMVTR